jgi:hypothetical protein
MLILNDYFQFFRTEKVSIFNLHSYVDPQPSFGIANKPLFMRIFFFIFFVCHCLVGRAQHAVYIYPNAQLNIQNGSTIVIKGGVSLGKSSQLVNNGSLYLSNLSNSYWTDSTYIFGSLQGTGRVYMNGTAPFFVYGASNFYDLTINCTALSVDTTTGMRISGQLVLQKGIIKTGKGSVTISNSNANAVIADPLNPGYAMSFINGNLAREITSNTNTYDFPVGDTSGIHLLSFQNNNLQGVHKLYASFGAKKGSDAGLSATEGAAYTAVHNRGVWTFSSDSTPTNGNYSVELSLNGYLNLQDNQFGILCRPVMSNSGADWIVPVGTFLPAAGGPGRTVLSGYAKRLSFQDFSKPELGIGITSGPLPVTLAYFRGQRLTDWQVRLEWQTQTETNNQGFFVERQVQDNSTFKQLGWIQTRANGNSSSPLNYSFIDSLNNYNYSVYRLRQVDLDGKTSYSPFVIIKGQGSNVRVYPNPSIGIIQIVSARRELFSYSISDGTGRTVKKGTAKSNTPILLHDLVDGYYTIIIVDNHREIVMTGKILLQKN